MLTTVMISLREVGVSRVVEVDERKEKEEL